MAYNLFLKNGSETGATVADKLNIIVNDLNTAELEQIPTKFNTIEGDINTLSTNLTNLEIDVNNLDTEVENKVDKISQGILAATLTSESTETLTTSYQKISWVDSVYVNETNSHMTYDTANNRVFFSTAGIYQIQAQANVTADNNRELTFKWYRNGVEFETTPAAVYIAQGNNKPISVSDSRVFVATVGDYLEVFAKADSNTDLVLKSSGLSVIKSCCSVS
jgi:hypothetical protein